MNYLNKNHIKFTVIFFNETCIKNISTGTPFDTWRLLTLTFSNVFHQTTNKMFKACIKCWLYSLDKDWFHRRLSLKYIISQTWQQIQHCQYDAMVGESLRINNTRVNVCLHLNSHPVYWWVRVAHFCSALCCPIVCFYVLSSVLRCPLRCPL